jgi:prepilin-type processing-associated H-X9-DG protein
MAADRNPTLDKNVTYLDRTSTVIGGKGQDGTKKTPYDYWMVKGATAASVSYEDPDLMWNSFSHQREGQNVLFNDGHVNFERTANAGIDNDNIWQRWPKTTPSTSQAKFDREVGGFFARGAASGCVAPVYGRASDTASWFPVSAEDTLLINDLQDCALNNGNW